MGDTLNYENIESLFVVGLGRLTPRDGTRCTFQMVRVRGQLIPMISIDSLEHGPMQVYESAVCAVACELTMQLPPPARDTNILNAFAGQSWNA